MYIHNKVSTVLFINLGARMSKKRFSKEKKNSHLSIAMTVNEDTLIKRRLK